MATSSVAAWQFEEAIECFRVIDSSLRCMYAGELHMYRPLSAQLRILLCDSPKPLLLRLFPSFKLQPLQPVKSYRPGNFPPELKHLNALPVATSSPVVVSCMPFEARVFYNGVEDCRPLLGDSNALMHIEEWVDQIISLHPKPVTIRRVIRTVANRGGGAHVHTAQDKLLLDMQGMSPGKLHLAALVIVAIAKSIQHVGHSIMQSYERHGTNATLPLLDFDDKHVCVFSSARVPPECFTKPYHAINLLSVGPAE